MNFKSKLPADPTSVILGTVSLVIVVIGCCCGFLAIISLALSIVGLVMANKSLKEFDRDTEVYDFKSRNNVSIGRIVCIIGIVVSSLFILIWSIYFIFVGETLTDELRKKYNLGNDTQFEISEDSISSWEDESQSTQDTIVIDTIAIDSVKQN